jgi:hypothetical protein
MVPSLSKEKHSANDATLVSTFFSSIFVKNSHAKTHKHTAKNTGNIIILQSENLTTAQAAKIGATNEAMALTNCPNVNVLAIRFSSTIFANNGFNETCKIVFPIPNSVNEINIVAKEYVNIGMSKAGSVMIILRSTVFFLPILFINNAVGTAHTRNQKKTIEGNKFAIVSDR